MHGYLGSAAAVVAVVVDDDDDEDKSEIDVSSKYGIGVCYICMCICMYSLYVCVHFCIHVKDGVHRRFRFPYQGFPKVQIKSSRGFLE